MSDLPKLPVGISTLRLLRESGFVYVDKTTYAHRLVRQPGRYFLSRPRRFCKSLFVDTLKEIFEGNRKLFEGLYIHQRWDWGRAFPVIKIDFAGGMLHSLADLEQKIQGMLAQSAKTLGVELELGDIQGRFGELIAGTHRRFGERVVVLVDEYDKPILDNIERPEVAAALREGLKNLYSVLKERDANLQFVFMTGVTKFSKVSLFSGVNQLNDITIDASYSSICGYTEADLHECFGGHLAGANLKEVRRWYNGNNWTGPETLYNPFDILLFIQKGFQFRNYWFETGSPGFLVKLFQARRYFLPSLEDLEVSEEILASFEVERIHPVTLLFQSGYLTIKSSFSDLGQMLFRLGVPNTEVKLALNNQLINAYTDLAAEKSGIQRLLRDQLLAADLEGIVATIKRLFASIPWRNFTGNDLADSEGYYASVLYAFFSALDARVIPEDISNQGQVDLSVMLGAQLYLIEIKVERDAAELQTSGGAAAPHLGLNQQAADSKSSNPRRPNRALEQIRARDYSAKYRGEPGKSVHELGLIFCSKQRNIIQADWIKLP